MGNKDSDMEFEVEERYEGEEKTADDEDDYH